MKSRILNECIDAIEVIMPKIMKSLQFTTLRDFFGMSPEVTLSQFYVLLAVFQDEGSPMNRIAQEMTLTPGTMTGLVDRLERVSLISRTRDREDRRSITLWLTEQGKSFMERFQTMKKNYLETILAKLNATQWKDITSSLKALDNAISELLEEGLFPENAK